MFGAYIENWMSSFGEEHLSVYNTQAKSLLYFRKGNIMIFKQTVCRELASGIWTAYWVRIVKAGRIHAYCRLYISTRSSEPVEFESSCKTIFNDICIGSVNTSLYPRHRYITYRIGEMISKRPFPEKTFGRNLEQNDNGSDETISRRRDGYYNYRNEMTAPPPTECVWINAKWNSTKMRSTIQSSYSG